MLRHKTSNNKFQRFKSYRVCSGQNFVRNRKIFGKSNKYLKIENTLLNNPWVKEDNTRQIREHVKLNDNGNIFFKNYGILFQDFL